MRSTCAKYNHQQDLIEGSPSQMPPERVLALRAVQDHKPVHVETTMEDWIRKLVGLPDRLHS
jgi:hypothetical protein